MTEEDLAADLRRALGGDVASVERLVDGLTPVIQARVVRVLLRRHTGKAAGRNIRQEVEDLTQEVFRQLFDHDRKVLRSWKAELGLTLAGFVGMIAERQAASILRSPRRSPWTEDPTLAEDLDAAVLESDPEEVAASREELRLLIARLSEVLSPLGRHLFDLLFVEQLSVPETTARTGLSADAVYAWRSRLRRLARKLLEELRDVRTGARRAKTLIE